MVEEPHVTADGQPDRVIRRLGPDDEATVGRLFLRFKGHRPADATEFLRDPTMLLLVAEEDGEVAGWLYAYSLTRPDGRRAMFLYELEVGVDSRRRGLGRGLLEALLAEANHRGHLKMWVLTDLDNEAAKALYQSAGGEGTQQMVYRWDLD